MLDGQCCFSTDIWPQTNQQLSNYVYRNQLQQLGYRKNTVSLWVIVTGTSNNTVLETVLTNACFFCCKSFKGVNSRLSKIKSKYVWSMSLWSHYLSLPSLSKSYKDYIWHFHWDLCTGITTWEEVEKKSQKNFLVSPFLTSGRSFLAMGIKLLFKANLFLFNSKLLPVSELWQWFLMQWDMTCLKYFLKG